MKTFLRLIIIILFLLFFSNHIVWGADDQCFNCHSDLGGTPAELFKNDIHHLAGLSCSDCHGGDSKSEDMDEAMNKGKGFIGVPKGNQISEICSRCHSNAAFISKYDKGLATNQMESIKNSVHGKLSLNGTDRIVQCSTCHNAHGIVSVNNPKSPVYPTNIPQTCNKCHGDATFMRSYNPVIAVDQLQKYRTSEHGILNAKGDPKPAQCVSCHGSHNILSTKDVQSSVYPSNIPKTCSGCHSNKEYMKQYGIPTDQYDKYVISAHGKALIEQNDVSAPVCNSCHGNHGAMPPGLTSISKVCGTCHVLNAELFSSSPHKKAFDKNNYPECETCHGHHDILPAQDKMLGVSSGAVCQKCHTPTENVNGYKAASKMKYWLDSLGQANALAKSLIFEAEQKGMEVEEAKFELRNINQAQLESRTVLHSFNEQKFKEVIDKGLTSSKDVIAQANSAINEYYFRRVGLGISVLIISFLIVILFLYIRKIEKEHPLKD
ncbi:MAG TPA: cytochrome c3 family protein [Ignavibacteriaceae bacterium]|nr:cytochrome c3 family protein [Ignavibacteriaceae bacterium]